MIGIPPHTAASYLNWMVSAGFKSLLTFRTCDSISERQSAIRALLAVTTCLPLERALNTTSLARVVPPMTSMTISMESSFKMESTWSVMVHPLGISKSRSLARSRTQIDLTWISCEQRVVR